MNLQELSEFVKGSGMLSEFDAAPKSKGTLFPEPAKINKGLGLKQLEELAPICRRGNYATGRKLSYSSLKGVGKNPLSYRDRDWE